MSPAYAKRLGLKTRKTNVGAQKFDGSTLKTFRMVIANFQVKYKGGRPRFFQETFLVADTKFEVVLEMPFLKISNADVAFGEGILMLKSYTTSEALATTKWVRLVHPKEFTIAALDADSETFVLHMANPGARRNGYGSRQESSNRGSDQGSERSLERSPVQSSNPEQSPGRSPTF